MSSSDLLKGLNESQQEAVQHIEGPLLILAGPGSGKTRVITHRIAFMIQQGIPSHAILGLTFTNKAAQEMRRRLDSLVGENSVWLGTFHGFCVRLLRRYARLVGLPENFNIYDVDDSQACLKSAVQEAKVEISHTTIGTLANRISYFKNRLVTPEILESEALSSDEYQVAQIYPYYQQALLKNGAVDFDDLLLHSAILLREHAELRQQLDERLRYVMVDEYQDTNLAQYVILRHLCVDHRNLAATGDPDQSIYGWRGANAKNVTHLERDYSDLHVVRLEHNYRSTPEILSIADCLIQNNEYRKQKQLVPSRSNGSAVRLAVYPTARSEAEDIADQIAALVNEGNHRLSDFGILYRTNAQSRLIEQALLRRQLHYQLIGGFRFYLRKEIKDLVSYLLLVHNPEDNVALQRAINIPPRGIGKQTITKLETLASSQRISLLDACREATQSGLLSSRASSSIKSFLKIFDALCSIAADPLQSLLEATIEMTKYREYLEKQKSSDEDRSEIFQNLDELLAEARELDAEPNDEQPALERFLEVAALQADTDKLKLGQESITLMTLHAAKGLEFPCVFIIAVEENILPHARSKDDPTQLEEERRLLFVGITRAQDQLQLSYAKSRGFSSQGSGVPSSFLMELPRSEMVILDRTENDYETAYNHGSGFDDYFESPEVTWDEACQIEFDDDLSEFVDYDEDCQLPPEEMKQRLLKRAQQKSTRKLSLGSSMSSSTSGGNWGKYRTGCIVSHHQYGSGEIISTSGHGPKRTVTINFQSLGIEKTFRLSHAQLTLVNSP